MFKLFFEKIYKNSWNILITYWVQISERLVSYFDKKIVFKIYIIEAFTPEASFIGKFDKTIQHFYNK